MTELRMKDAAAVERECQPASKGRQGRAVFASIIKKWAAFTVGFAIFAFLFLAVGLTPVFSAQLNVPLTIQETIYPGAPTTGITRVEDPVTVGIPIADSAGISSISQLGLVAASAGQFRVLGRWPSGNIQWVLVDTEADLSAGGQSSSIVLTEGAGNFGGPNLATDNGATIAVNTGAAQFTIRKAHFDLFDSVVVGGKTLVAPATSAGLVVTTSGSNLNTACQIMRNCTASAYSSANDALSTAILEENGPVKAVIKATGYHRDTSGNPYLGFTVRMYFYKGKSSVKVVSILRNADHGVSNSFQTAFKMFSSYEARVALNLGSSSAKFSFGNSPGAPAATGSFAGTENAYLYQAYSNNMETCDWSDTDGHAHGPRSPIHRVQGAPPAGYTCQVYWDYSQNGYKVVHGTATLNSADHSSFPEGWADIADSSGAGIEIGVYQMSSYWPKSLQFMNGGREARVGIWPDQSLFGAGGQAYVSEWPQWKIQTLYFNFHGSNLPSASDDFLAFQHNLIARAAPSYYNSTNVFFYPIPNASEEDSFVAQFGVPGAPQDFAPKVWRHFEWENAGGGNQEDHRGIALMKWLERGFTGAYVSAVHSFQHVEEEAFPHADFPGGWRSRPATDLDNRTGGFGYPSITSLNTDLFCDAGVNFCGRLWNKDEHTHFYFMPDYYFMTGDETVNDAIQMGGPYDRYLSPNSNKNSGQLSSTRSVGIELMWEARLNRYLSAIGDSANGETTMQIANATVQALVYPALLSNGYGESYEGMSQSRGIHFVGGNAQGLFRKRERLTTTFQSSILLEGINEYLTVACPSWPNVSSSSECNKLADTAYGIASWGLNEAWVPSNMSPAGGCGGAIGGFAYSVQVDQSTGQSSINRMCGWSDWFFFYTVSRYMGNTTQWSWLDKFEKYYLPGVVAKMPEATFATERGGIFQGAVLDQILAPPAYTLVDVPVQAIERGQNSYLLSWIVPAGATSYRIKYSNRTIVDWLGFNPLNYTFALSPTTNQPWFSATDFASVPPPAAPGSTQSLTVTGLDPTQVWHFAMKAYVSAAHP